MSLPEKKIYVGTERCGLCRSQLPWNDKSDLNLWDLDFRAAFCLVPNDENTIEITKAANLSHIHDRQIDVGLNSDPQNQSITICHYQQRFRTKRTYPTAYCFHAWCYDTLIQKFEGATESEIYRLSEILSLHSLLWESRHMRRQEIEPISTQTLRKLADSYQPLDKLLRLPVELRNMVWEYIGPKAAFSATVLVAEETTRLLRALNHPDYQTVSLTQGSRVSVKMLTVFGTSYIQSLSDESYPEVVYLKFAMVYGGICALRLYGDNWNTSWHGVLPKSGRTWYGCICRPGKTLTCSSNGLYLTSLSSSMSSLDDQIVWDQPDIPMSLSNPNKELFDFNRDVILSYGPPEVRQPRYFGYLPLLSNNEYVNGLTVYLSGNGIVGMESHFAKVSRLIGGRHGCPNYFQFDPGERIAFTWLRIINSQSYAFAAPTVTIQTTFGRIHTFGPYVLPQYVMNDKYKWFLLDRPGSITGFYFEWPDSVVIMRIGVIRDSHIMANRSPTLEFTACGAPYLPNVGPNAGLFLSVANLSNLRKVEICRVGIRCTGLKLHYLKTPTAVLGQWHTTHFSQHVSISNSNSSNEMGLCFKFSKSGDHQFITDISFGTDKSDDCNSRYFGLGETIIWWFSKSNDVVCLWDGRFVLVPERSIINVK